MLARIFHPDVDGDDEQMKRINHAWSILGNPRLRAEYDRQLAGRHPGPAGQSAPVRTAASPFAGAARSEHHDAPPTPRRSPPPPRRRDPMTMPARRRASRSGPLLTFGRYDGWTIGQVARVDPPFLEWLRRVPAGRQIKDADRRRAPARRRRPARSAFEPTPRRPMTRPCTAGPRERRRGSASRQWGRADALGTNAGREGCFARAPPGHDHRRRLRRPVRRAAARPGTNAST